MKTVDELTINEFNKIYKAVEYSIIYNAGESSPEELQEKTVQYILDYYGGLENAYTLNCDMDIDLVLKAVEECKV